MIHVQKDKVVIKNMTFINQDPICINIDPESSIPCEIIGNTFLSGKLGGLLSEMAWERKFWIKLKLAIKYLFSK